MLVVLVLCLCLSISLSVCVCEREGRRGGGWREFKYFCVPVWLLAALFYSWQVDHSFFAAQLKLREKERHKQTEKEMEKEGKTVRDRHPGGRKLE